MQRFGSTPKRRTNSTSPLVARSKKAPSPTEGRDQRCMRQRLQGVVQINARQRCAETAILLTHAFGIDDEQGRAVASHQMLDRLSRERILLGIEFHRGASLS